MSDNRVDARIKEVAERLRAAREDSGRSVAEMAAAVGVDVREYEEYERGEKDFSFSFIYKFAAACGLEMTEIMEGTNAFLSNYTVTRRGEGMPIVRREGFVYNRLAAMFRNKIAEPFYVKIPYDPKALEKPLHLGTHKGQEFDVVIPSPASSTVWAMRRDTIISRAFTP